MYSPVLARTGHIRIGKGVGGRLKVGINSIISQQCMTVLGDRWDSRENLSGFFFLPSIFWLQM